MKMRAFVPGDSGFLCEGEDKQARRDGVGAVRSRKV